MLSIIKLIFDIIKELFKYSFKIQNYDPTIISILNHIGNYNIVFVKIFQWVCIKNKIEPNSFITDNIAQSIYKFTTNTPFKESDYDYLSLLKIYKIANDQGDKFELDNLVPINSGTISLIFKGKLNGKDIAIKLLRKNIKQDVKNCIDLLSGFENIIYRLPIINKYYTKIFETNKSNILNQVDFIKECENIKLFYNSFKKNKIIMIPNVYSVYTQSNPNLIIMDWIEGKYLYSQSILKLYYSYNNLNL